MAGTGGQYYDSKVMAQLFGVSVRRIQQLTQDGVIETVPLKVEGRTVRRYELVPTIQAYTKYLADKAYGREQINTEAELKEQKLKAEIALKESQGELHRLRTAIAAGEYISIEEARADYTKFFAVLKRFCAGLPSRVTGMVGTRIDPVASRELEKDLNTEINDMLRTFVLAADAKDGGDG